MSARIHDASDDTAKPDYAAYAYAQVCIFEQYTWHDWRALCHYEPTTPMEARALARALACFVILASETSASDIARFIGEGTLSLNAASPRLRCLPGGLLVPHDATVG